MGLSNRACPDCGRRVSEPFVKTITGREVCPECANALFLGSAAGTITGEVGTGFGVWAMLMRKVRRRPAA
jgi:ribosomal protein S27AE